MSEYIGEAKVKILPDASGFASTAQQQIEAGSKQIGSSTSAMRAGAKNLDDTLKQAALRAANVEAGVANLASTIKDLGKAGSDRGIQAVAGYIKSLESSIADLSNLRAGAKGPILAQLNNEIGNLAPQLAQAQSEFERLTGATNANTVAVEKNVAANSKSLTLNQRLRQFGVRGASRGGVAAVAGYALSQNLTGLSDDPGVFTSRAGGFVQSLSTLNLTGAIKAAGGATKLTDDQVQRLANSFDVAKLKALGAVPGFKQYTDAALELKKASFEAGSAVANAPDNRDVRGPGGLASEVSGVAGPRPGAQTQDYQLKVLRAQITKTNRDDLEIAQNRSRYLRNLIKGIEDEGASTEQSKSDLQNLYGELLSTNGSIASIEESINAARKESLEKSINLKQVNLQIEQANARTDGDQISALNDEVATAQKLSQNKLLSVQERKGFELQAAQANKEIYGIQEAQRAEAKRQAEEEARIAAEEKKRNEEKLKRQQDAYQQLIDLRLQNRLAVAEQTKTIADDRKVILAMIKRDKELIANSTGLEREQARSRLIADRGRLAGLKKGSATGSTNDFFRQVISDFRSYGSNFSSSANGELSGQGARGQFAGLALGNASNAQLQKAYQAEANRLARIRTRESILQTKHLGVIAGVVAGTGLRLPNNKVPGVGASVAVGLAGANVHGS